jgi:hypothetical protein
MMTRDRLTMLKQGNHLSLEESHQMGVMTATHCIQSYIKHRDVSAGTSRGSMIGTPVPPKVCTYIRPRHQPCPPVSASFNYE